VPDFREDERSGQDVGRSGLDRVEQVLGVMLSRSKALRGRIAEGAPAWIPCNSGSGFEIASRYLRDAHEIGREIWSPASYESAESELEAWSADGIRTISIFDVSYPPLLRAAFEPPPILFYRGKSPGVLLERPMIAVVGARSARPSSASMAHELACALSQAGACVVSGLALGIDAAAHRGSLDTGRDGSTIAVLGNGLYSTYPGSHFELGTEIVESGGLLLSQFEPREKPFPQNFLARNRIIAGMCKAVIVVQAAERSGSLVTARFALEEGRDVLALPGGVGDEAFRGSNKLIKQGAYLITELSDIFEYLPDLKPPPSSGKRRLDLPVTPLQKRVLKLLAAESRLHFDRLPEDIRSSPGFELAICELEIGGLIEREPGNYLVRCSRLRSE
jgi:DNA processing protein